MQQDSRECIILNATMTRQAAENSLTRQPQNDSRQNTAESGGKNLVKMKTLMITTDATALTLAVRAEAGRVEAFSHALHNH